MIYIGSVYCNRAWRRNGWGDFFGFGYSKQGKNQEMWIALFGRTFWLGIEKGKSQYLMLRKMKRSRKR